MTCFKSTEQFSGYFFYRSKVFIFHIKIKVFLFICRGFYVMLHTDFFSTTEHVDVICHYCSTEELNVYCQMKASMGKKKGLDISYEK